MRICVELGRSGYIGNGERGRGRSDLADVDRERCERKSEKNEVDALDLDLGKDLQEKMEPKVEKENSVRQGWVKVGKSDNQKGDVTVGMKKKSVVVNNFK